MNVVEGNFVEGYSEEVINPLIETSVYSIFEVMFEVQAGFEDLLWRRLPPDPQKGRCSFRAADFPTLSFKTCLRRWPVGETPDWL
jgi:hypothetical protein